MCPIYLVLSLNDGTLGVVASSSNDDRKTIFESSLRVMEGTPRGILVRMGQR